MLNLSPTCARRVGRRRTRLSAAAALEECSRGRCAPKPTKRTEGPNKRMPAPRFNRIQSERAAPISTSLSHSLSRRSLDISRRTVRGAARRSSVGVDNWKLVRERCLFCSSSSSRREAAQTARGRVRRRRRRPNPVRAQSHHLPESRNASLLCAAAAAAVATCVQTHRRANRESTSAQTREAKRKTRALQI